jgi:hypothetical protein
MRCVHEAEIFDARESAPLLRSGPPSISLRIAQQRSNQILSAALVEVDRTDRRRRVGIHSLERLFYLFFQHTTAVIERSAFSFEAISHLLPLDVEVFDQIIERPLRRRGLWMMPDHGSGRGVENQFGAAARADDGETGGVSGMGILVRHGCTIPKTGPGTYTKPIQIGHKLSSFCALHCDEPYVIDRAVPYNKQTLIWTNSPCG